MNILLQTVLDGAASAVMWYLVGFGFAYGIGDHPNGFVSGLPASSWPVLRGAGAARRAMGRKGWGGETRVDWLGW